MNQLVSQFGLDAAIVQRTVAQISLRKVSGLPTTAIAAELAKETLSKDDKGGV